MKQFILALVIAASPAAFASSTVIVTFTGLPATQGNGTTNSQGNTYNGPGIATVAGIPNADLVCDDFTNTTYVPSGPLDYSVNTISSLTSSDVDFSSGFVTGLTGEAAGGMTQTQAYDTVAVLTANLETPGSTAQQIADYQYAIWDLMEPGASNDSTKDSPLDANAASYLQSAFTAVTAASPASATLADEKALVIYTPTSGYSSNQEFVGLNTPTGAIPEPSTWILMAALGLLMCLPQTRSLIYLVLHR
jgi:hypothetical protein